MAPFWPEAKSRGFGVQIEDGKWLRVYDTDFLGDRTRIRMEFDLGKLLLVIIILQRTTLTTSTTS